jgi:hypothetical protein
MRSFKVYGAAYANPPLTSAGVRDVILLTKCNSNFAIYNSEASDIGHIVKSENQLPKQCGVF